MQNLITLIVYNKMLTISNKLVITFHMTCNIQSSISTLEFLYNIGSQSAKDIVYLRSMFVCQPNVFLLYLPFHSISHSASIKHRLPQLIKTLSHTLVPNLCMLGLTSVTRLGYFIMVLETNCRSIVAGAHGLCSLPVRVFLSCTAKIRFNSVGSSVHPFSSDRSQSHDQRTLVGNK